MKMSELFARIDRSQKNSDEPSAERWASELGIELSWDNDIDDELAKRMVGYWAVKWYCTDTWVGMQLWFLDGEPVGLTLCKGRKCGTEVEFVNNEQALKLRDVILELVALKKPEERFALIDMDEEIGDYYTINYGSQLLVSEGVYNGEAAKVVKSFDRYDEIDKWQTLVVETPSGQATIGMDEFHIPYPLEEQP